MKYSTYILIFLYACLALSTEINWEPIGQIFLCPLLLFRKRYMHIAYILSWIHTSLNENSILSGFKIYISKITHDKKCRKRNRQKLNCVLFSFWNVLIRTWNSNSTHNSNVHVSLCAIINSRVHIEHLSINAINFTYILPYNFPINLIDENICFIAASR